jgi:predicted nucleic acid-binding protein
MLQSLGLGLNGLNGNRHKPKVCLDTSVFTALFVQEEDKWKMARDILQDGREGRVQVVVSTLVLIECENSPRVNDEQDESGATTMDLVADFFESEYLTRCNVDPFTGELARQLRRELSGVAPLGGNSWLWLATALLAECDYLMTYERRLHKLAGQTALGKLQVGLPSRPWDAGQLSLTDVEGVMDAAPAVGAVTRRSLVI